jgi:glutathione S-transferase
MIHFQRTRKRSMIKLFWCPNTRSMRALWLFEEAGIPYERVQINIRDPNSKSDPAFRAASPQGKVPAIEDGPVRISDSGAICIYVADQYPQTQLAPRVGDPKRGAFLQWTLFNNTSIEPAMVEKLANLKPNPSTYGWGDFNATMDVLRNGARNAAPWMLGERFSAADVMIGSAIRALFTFKILERRNESVLAAYEERCMARPAAQAASKLNSGQAESL